MAAWLNGPVHLYPLQVLTARGWNFLFAFHEPLHGWVQKYINGRGANCMVSVISHHRNKTGVVWALLAHAVAPLYLENVLDASKLLRGKIRLAPRL